MWWVAAAWGQDGDGVEIPRIDAQRFRPSVDAAGFLWVDQAGRVEEHTLHSRVLLGYTDRPLVDGEQEGERVDLVEDLWSLDLLFGIQAGRLRGGVRVPVVLLARSDVLPTEGGLGDVQLDGRVTALDGDDAPFDAAATFRVTLPTDTLENALGTEQGAMEIALAASRRFGAVYAAANVGIHETTTVDTAEGTVGPSVPVRVGVGGDVGDGVIAAELAGWLPIVDGGRGGLEALASTAWAAGEQLDVHFAVGTGLVSGPGSPLVRLELGIGSRSPLQTLAPY